MDIQNLKEYILENEKIPTVLEELGCHHIKHKDGYYCCGNPDGDNNAAISVYENEYLTCINYTRDLSHGKNSNADILSLVEFFKQCSFFEAIKIVCDWIDIDYYHDFDEDLPESIKLTKLIMEMRQGNDVINNEKPLKPIPEQILQYYDKYVNDMFGNDNIDYATQKLFEIGYDEESNRITIPIRDELGNLVGVKGRLFEKDLKENELKYLYLEPCCRSQILFGLNNTYQYIKEQGKVYVGEAEKSCLQLWSMGIYNSVATSGKKVSNSQIEKLTRLCVDIVFLFDKDVSKDEISELSSRFVDGVNIYAVIDDKNILTDKESPTDNPEKFKRLVENCMCKIK